MFSSREVAQEWFQLYYESATLFFKLAPLIVGPLLFVIDAPFGRFSPKNSKFVIDGHASWIIMESISPILFLITYFFAPFSITSSPPPLQHPSTILATLFVLHYLNRAFISPLRAPGRSKAHVFVTFAAIIFNSLNPPLMAAYLSASPSTDEFTSTYSPSDPPSTKAWSILTSIYQYILNLLGITPESSFPVQGPTKELWSHPSFYLGLALFFIGFASNIFHDEILYDIRRKNPPREDGKPHYAIPEGWLYNWISYPNYLSEWVEWTGYAIAASAGETEWKFTPPWMFLVAEIMVMLPRAWKGHQWYRERFGAAYPSGRKAVIPYLL